MKKERYLKKRYQNKIVASLLSKIILLAIYVIVLTGCAMDAQEMQPMIVEKPQYPAKVEAADLQPGLAVLYFYDFYRYINEMPTGEKIKQKGKPGPPILQLNHQFKDGKVFDSGESRGVGMVMTGYFHLGEPGEYAFQALSNDGFELYINDNLLISDPRVHRDRLSDPGILTVAQGGWFPVMIKYYQRKGTAALKLYWQPPGAGSFVIIPANVYGHLTDSEKQ